MKHALSIACILAALSVLAPGPAAAAHETVGVVRSSSGSASVTRDGKVLPAPPGAKILEGDVLVTGADGSMGIILRDNSTLSLGPESSVTIRNFHFSPAEGKLDLLVRISRGTMAYLSGLIGRLSPESARFETPVATIGIRGTRFAVKVDD